MEISHREMMGEITSEGKRMRLLVIEPTRKKPKTGDVFVIQPVSRRFLYGHVVKTNLVNRDPMIKGWNLIFMFRHRNDKFDLPESFDDLEFLIPPLIVNNQGWLKGREKMWR